MPSQARKKWPPEPQKKPAEPEQIPQGTAPRPLLQPPEHAPAVAESGEWAAVAPAKAMFRLGVSPCLPPPAAESDAVTHPRNRTANRSVAGLRSGCWRRPPRETQAQKTAVAETQLQAVKPLAPPSAIQTPTPAAEPQGALELNPRRPSLPTPLTPAVKPLPPHPLLPTLAPPASPPPTWRYPSPPPPFPLPPSVPPPLADSVDIAPLDPADVPTPPSTCDKTNR